MYLHLIHITYLLYSFLFPFIHYTYNVFWRISVISVNKMMTVIKINDSVIYDLSYVMNFDTYHLFYINMSIKNNDSVIYDLTYVINMPHISRIKEGMTINMIIRIYMYIYM